MARTYPMSPAPLSPRARQNRDFANLGLWTFQGWIAMFFIAAGYAKLTEPLDNLVLLMRWPELVGESLVRGVGIVEIVLALGVLAPLLSWKIGRWPLLVSTVGLIAMQATMLTVHAIGLDLSLALTNAALLAITSPVFLDRRHPR